tara:strand:- start:569 stop:856 length:288 start_codon:yes stop_codon:yes gene_type:complete
MTHTTTTFNWTESEVLNAMNVIANRIMNLDKVLVEITEINYSEGEGAGFDLSFDGIPYEGGSYYVKDNGDVINAAISNQPCYYTIKKNEADVLRF